MYKRRRKVVDNFEHFDLDQVVIVVNDNEEYTIVDICDINHDIDIIEDEVVVLLDEYVVDPREVILFYGEGEQSDIIYDVISNGETSCDIYPRSVVVEELVLEEA